MAEQEITKLSLERYSPEAKALIVETQALADSGQQAPEGYHFHADGSLHKDH